MKPKRYQGKPIKEPEILLHRGGIICIIENKNNGVGTDLSLSPQSEKEFPILAITARSLRWISMHVHTLSPKPLALTLPPTRYTHQNRGQFIFVGNSFQALDFDSVIPAKAGIQKSLAKPVFEYRAKGLEDSPTYLDSRLHGNDMVTSMTKETHPREIYLQT